MATAGAMIGRYERGEITPSIDVVRRLAEIFDVTIDYLVRSTDLSDVVNDKEIMDRWEALNELSEEDRDRILFMVDGLIRDARARQTYR